MKKKKTGSFYTPIELVRYMVDWAISDLNFLSVLEPSAGDGRFVYELLPYGKEITALEIMSRKSRKIRNKFSDVISQTADFVDYSLHTDTKYDLIIGNPPYISKKDLSKKYRRRSIELVESFDLDDSYFQNLWVSFILGALRVLKKGGAILYVLPFEFLQVQYAEKLRDFLEQHFSRIEIVTFEERAFPNIEQDICVVLMQDEDRTEPIIRYKTLDSIKTLNEVFCSSIKRNKPLKKWANCIVDDDETDFLTRLKKTYPTINSFGEIAPGIVTGANNYFILDSHDVALYGLSNICVPIIQKSQDVGNRLIFGKKDLMQCSQSKKRTYLLNTNNLASEAFTPALEEYLLIGEQKEIHKRYKCSRRNRWHDVPLVRSGTISFFKRYGFLPRIIVNEEEVYTTDSAYNIRLNKQYDPYSFVFSFYNSLTLTMCEYNGRFYGGGVCELVPSEFKELPIPYTEIELNTVIELDNMFRNNIDISRIIDYVDSIVLKISDPEMQLLKRIRNRYLKRRLKN